MVGAVFDPFDLNNITLPNEGQNNNNFNDGVANIFPTSFNTSFKCNLISGTSSSSIHNDTNTEYVLEDKSLSKFEVSERNEDINQNDIHHRSFGNGNSDLISVDSRSLKSMSNAIENKIPRKVSSEEIKLALKEEMNCIYDSISRSSSCIVTGSIQIKKSSCNKAIAAQDSSSSQIHILIKDPKCHIENFQISEDGVNLVSNYEVQRESNNIENSTEKETQNNHSFLLTIPKNLKQDDRSEKMHTFPICKYTCKTSTLLLPLIVQNKVSIINKVCRVMIQITSNPTNASKLSNLSIIMAVPPNIDGDSINVSVNNNQNYQNYHWDKLKRLLVWNIPELKSGRVLELHLQCSFASGSSTSFDNNFLSVLLNKKKNESNSDLSTTTTATSSPSPVFPVMVRCSSFRNQLSKIEIFTSKAKEAADTSSLLSSPSSSALAPVPIYQSHSFRVLYRKI